MWFFFRAWPLFQRQNPKAIIMSSLYLLHHHHCSHTALSFFLNHPTSPKAPSLPPTKKLNQNKNKNKPQQQVTDHIILVMLLMVVVDYYIYMCLLEEYSAAETSLSTNCFSFSIFPPKERIFFLIWSSSLSLSRFLLGFPGNQASLVRWFARSKSKSNFLTFLTYDQLLIICFSKFLDLVVVG